MEIVGKLYSCEATVVSSEDLYELLEVTGEHDSEFTDFDVESLYLRNQNLDHIPSGIEKFFPNLKAIEWHNSNLVEISADDLKPFPELLLFSANTNKVKSLDGDLFKHTANIQSIDFFNNSISYVGDGIFANLNELAFAQFEGNPCVDYCARNFEEIMELNEILPSKCSTTTTRRTTTRPGKN